MKDENKNLTIKTINHYEANLDIILIFHLIKKGVNKLRLSLPQPLRRNKKQYCPYL